MTNVPNTPGEWTKTILFITGAAILTAIVTYYTNKKIKQLNNELE